VQKNCPVQETSREKRANRGANTRVQAYHLHLQEMYEKGLDVGLPNYIKKGKNMHMTVLPTTAKSNSIDPIINKILFE